MTSSYELAEHRPSKSFAVYLKNKAAIAGVATAGYSVLLNYTQKGPEFYESTFPQDWQDEYELKRYYMKDPVAIWAVAKNGDKRWSSIIIPDVFRVLKRAEKHGLVYGAIFTRSLGKKKSLFSVSRADREITDEEMAFLSSLFTEFVETSYSEKKLTSKELEVLRCLSMDMTVSEAAKHLKLTESAAKARLSSARQRLGCETNYMAIATAFRDKLIQ